MPDVANTTPPELLDARLPHERKERNVPMNMPGNAVPIDPPRPEKPSYAVDAIREQHTHDAGTAEETARRIADHIRAVDKELDALSDERGRLAKECLEAVKAMARSSEKFQAIAANDYRDPQAG